ncbi:MAG: Nif3-like dinuclear metal center hexameric protein [Clostridia bacterium]|nr:Nif3-like dinuclear metal center hexameric protein [Clostridia bacterium]
MKLNEIITYLEAFAPPQFCESWDNVGLMLGSREQQINRCFVALDITDSVIDCAIRNECDLIVTHHPFIMDGLKSIDLDTLKGKQVHRLLLNNIAVYSMHTNFDSCAGGVNDILCEKLGLTDYQVDEQALCRKGSFPEAMKFRDVISLVKDVLQVTYVNYTGDLNRSIKTAAVLGGSGGSLVNLMTDCDVYLTGEAKYHEFQTAQNEGLCMITAGHFETEAPALDKLRELLEQLNLEVIRQETYRGFYQII